MTHWKDALCLLAIFVAYGLAGHMDYQDAVAMEEAMREDTSQLCSMSTGATAEPTPLFSVDAKPVRHGTPASISAPACVPELE
ncbi:hypothetical protein PEC18_03815 [Paucibacter sp. O1-1]|nr:hypothetical protein [Paucibacter sp. O1-1]MDA3825002.1 hypothetical protein [Paucibacter sp. O1-1]